MADYSVQQTEFLLQCMRQRRDILQDIRLLTDSLSSAAHAADAEVSLGILARKDALLEEFSKVRQALRQYEQDDPERRIWTSPARRAECQQLADEGNRFLAETVHIDQATLQELHNHQQAIAAQLQNGTDSILARSAYTAGQQIGESILDVGNL